MAISGVGLEYDITLKAGASLRTSTSQYLVVGAHETTTSDDWTAIISNDSTTAGTTSAHYCIGINQTPAMSSASTNCRVRLFGISKAICACSVPAWSFVTAYRGISTTTRRGHIEPVGYGQTQTANITSTNFVILGRAMEDGSSNSVISVFVNPQAYPLNNVTLAAT